MLLLHSGKSSEVQYFVYSSLKFRRCVILVYWLHNWDTLTSWCSLSLVVIYFYTCTGFLFISVECASIKTLCNDVKTICFMTGFITLTNIIMYMIASLHSIFDVRPNIYFIGLCCYEKNIIYDHHTFVSFFV